MSLSKNFPVVSPTLLLDFAAARRLDPRITFTRNSPGTYYDGVTTAVAEQNLILWSQEFQQTAWDAVTLGTTVTANTTVAPDGTTTADTLAFVATAYRYNSYTAGTLTGRTFTFSCWVWTTTAKPVIGVRISNSSGTEATALQRVLTGTATRVSVTRTFGGADTVIICGFDNRSAQGGNNIAGSIVVWGAQLEERSTATAYNLTTTATVTNYVPVLLTAAAGVARFTADPVTGSSLGLMMEIDRTNLVLQSEDFNNAAWIRSASTVTVNTNIAPNGTQTADTWIPDSGRTSGLPGVLRQDIALADSTSYSFSMYVKTAGITSCNLQFFDKALAFSGTKNLNLTTGVLSGSDTNCTSSVQAVGNGWYRLVCAGVNSGTGVNTPSVRLVAPADAQTANGFAGIFVWGAQLEAGSFATSYIATTTGTQLRNADTAAMTGTNFSSWYNAGEGTLYIESTFEYQGASSFPRLLTLVGTDPNFDDIAIYFQTTGVGPDAGKSLFSIIVAGTQVGGLTPAPQTVLGSTKSAFAYKLNDLAASTFNLAVTTDNSSIIPVCIALRIYGQSRFQQQPTGIIKKIAYYDSRLTNAQLSSLTAN
jgi:hypothetical protein